MEKESEKELIKEIHQDPSKFCILFDQYYSPVFRYVYRRLANYELARDITSESFLKAYRNMYKFQWKGISVASWLYRIATNEMNQFFRKKKYVPDSLNYLIEYTKLDITDPDSVKEKLLLEEEMEKHKEFELIRKKIGLLKIEYQEVLTLRYFENKTIREVAEILGKKEGTIKSLASRALDKLRELL